MLAALVIGRPSSAGAADVQVWGAAESRVTTTERGGLTPDQVRIVTESRFSGSHDGLAFLLVRGGPMWRLHPNLAFNLNGVQSFEADDDGVLRRGTRLEIEPSVRASPGPFNVNLRQRFDFRWNRAELEPRYRAQLRLNYQPHGSSIAPFIAGEGFVATRGRVTEMRTLAGISILAPAHLRLDVAYMWRPRRTEVDWTVTHALVLTITFTPKIEPIFDSGGG